MKIRGCNKVEDGILLFVSIFFVLVLGVRMSSIDHDFVGFFLLLFQGTLQVFCSWGMLERGAL
jgi:hypothetical protein